MASSIEAEKAVLGACLIDANAVGVALSRLNRVSFEHPVNRKIFDIIGGLYSEGMSIDQVSVGTRLPVAALYIAQLATEVVTAMNIENHCKLVRDAETLRKVDLFGAHLSELAREPRAVVSDVLSEAGKALFELSEYRDGGVEELSNIIRDVWQIAENGLQGGVPTGLTALDDKLLGALRPPDLIVLAARPSMGKSALAFTIVRNVALDHNVPVLIFSLEMSREQVGQRMLAMEARVNMHHLRNGTMSSEEWGRAGSVIEKLHSAPVRVVDRTDMDVMEMRAEARKMKSEKRGLGLVVVDYLQLMESSGENRNNQIDSICRQLKQMAKEVGVPVLLLSQLSRAVEQRGGDHKPMLSDLRDSGAIEQHADIVILLYRAEYYGKTEDSNGESLEGIAELIVPKQRNGPTGYVTVQWNAEHGRFQNLYEGQEPLILY